MTSQCNCPKWYEVISAHQLLVLLQKYLEHPKYGKDFKIHQPCFMCQNDDRIECYGTDEFNATELFSKLPHPETLNYYFLAAETAVKVSYGALGYTTTGRGCQKKNPLTTKYASIVVISVHTAELIKCGVSYNTIKAYGWVLQKLNVWLSTVVNLRELNDMVLSEYITHLHESGKSPVTIAQAVAAVKWQSNNLRRNIVGVVINRTLAGIWRARRRYADYRSMGRS